MKQSQAKKDTQLQPTSIEHRIEQLLEEIRIVLPGTEVFLGFQLAAVFQNGFAQLPNSLKVIHFFSLLHILVTVMFLIIPPAFHRIVEKGDDTERFPHVAGRLILIAMFFLAVGVSLELFVVSQIIFKDTTIAYITSIGTFTVLSLAWFGFNFIIKMLEWRKSK